MHACMGNFGVSGCQDTVKGVQFFDCPRVTRIYQATPSILQCRLKCLKESECFAIEWADNKDWSSFARTSNCYLLKKQGRVGIIDLWP